MIEVILCSYNGEKHIATQIDSILGQKMSGLKIHVYDDASTDSTPAILKDYKYQYPDVFDYTIRGSSTGSSCKNFLLSIKESEEFDYYMLSDQDDRWYPDKAGKLLACINHHESTIAYGKTVPVIVHSDAVVTDENLEAISKSFIRYEKISPERTGFNQLLLQNCVTGGACIFNKAMRNIIKGAALPEKAAIHDHWMAIAASAFGKIYYLDEKLYDYRQHNDNQIGAYKASFIGETMRRLGLGNESKKEIDAITKSEFNRLFMQAEEFLKIYGDKLNDDQKEICRAFISLPSMNRAQKIATVTKYGFFFNNYYRAIGELLFI